MVMKGFSLILLHNAYKCKSVFYIMLYAYLIPNWFFPVDFTFSVLNALITLAVAITALMVYRASDELAVKRFGLGFGMIAIAYIIWAADLFLLLNSIQDGIRVIILDRAQSLGFFSYYLYIIFFVCGIVTLAYSTFKINKDGVYYLLLGTSLLVVASSLYKFITLGILNFFILSYISYHYFTRWIENKNRNTLYLCISFALLSLSGLHYVFGASSFYSFVICHTIEFLAYALMFKALISSLKYYGNNKVAKLSKGELSSNYGKEKKPA